MSQPAKSIYGPSTGCVTPGEHAIAHKKAWVRMALQYLRVNSPTWIGFTAEDVAIDMRVSGYPAAQDLRWWGAVMQQAKREGMISQFGDGTRTAMTRAGHRSPLWKGCRT